MILSLAAETNYNLGGTEKLHNWTKLITENVLKETMEKYRRDEDQT
jgi:hypothetical protein